MSCFYISMEKVVFHEGSATDSINSDTSTRVGETSIWSNNNNQILVCCVLFILICLQLFNKLIRKQQFAYRVNRESNSHYPQCR